MEENCKEVLCLGIAGNFANHLEQAGEAGDFANIISDEKDAPKGIFPFYIPQSRTNLGRYCIDNDKLILPQDSSLNVQAEPELGLECEIIYDKNHKIASIKAMSFFAFNDASVRNDATAKKISQKKNFSLGSKGMGAKIAIDTFGEGGICDDYSLTSFLIVGGNAHQYGNNTKLSNYSYFYQKLLDWITKKLNTQEDYAVLENLSEVIKEANFPKKLIIAIGSTSYTPLGEDRYLKEGDEIAIITYNHTKHTNEDIKNLIKNGAKHIDSASVVRQAVVRS